jgi:hypothetical protein
MTWRIEIGPDQDREDELADPTAFAELLRAASERPDAG